MPCPIDAITGAICGGKDKGTCSYSPITGRPYCECEPNYFGFTCQFSKEKLEQRKEELRAAVNAATEAAGEAKAEKAACVDPEKPFLCPDVDAVASTKGGVEPGWTNKPS